MSPWIRRIGLALAAVLLVAIAAAAWLIASFDPNRYKSVAVDWMKTHRNRTLVIGGPIELSVFPRVAVKLSQVTLSETGRAEQFAAIDQAALSVAVLPLLRGALQVDRVEASGVSVTLRRDAKGRRNTDDLGGSTAPAPAEESKAGGKALDFDISRVELKDLRARFEDAGDGPAGELQLVELSSGRLASGVESPLQFKARFDMKRPALKGELSGSTRVTPELTSGSVRLAGMKLAYRGELPGASAVDTSIEGALAWDGAKGALDARELSLKLAANAAGVQLKDSSLAIQHFGFDPARQALAIDKLALRIKGTRGGEPLALELDWPELDIEGQRLKGSPLQGKLALGGATPLDLAFRTGAPTGSFEAVALPAVEGRISSTSATRKAEGTLRANLGLKPAQTAASLDALELKASLQDGAGKPLTVAARGSASGSPKAAQWALAGQVNSNAFTIDGSANLAGAVPFVKAQARFDALDLNTLLPPAASSGTAAPGTPAPADAPVDLAGLRALNANVSLRAGSLVFRQYHVTDARLDATLDNGLLKVPALQGKAWGGALDASASADARGNRVAVKAAASGVDVNALLKDVAGKDLLEGKGRVTLDVDSAGRSVGELRSKLHGNAALQLRDGAIKGINLAKSLRQAKAALGLKSDSSQKASQAEKTDFSELSASFQIAEGIARSSDLDVKSPFLRLGGEGLVDVGRGRIDYTARATVTNTSAGQGGAELAALKGLTVPVHLTGPFEAIDWKIQWSAVAAGALQNKVEDKLKERLGLGAPQPAASGASAPASAKDQLKNKLLKGLLK